MTDGCQKDFHEMEIQRTCIHDTVQRVLSIQRMLVSVQTSEFQQWTEAEHQWSWNLRFDEIVKEFVFIKDNEDACVYKKVSGSIIIFLKTLCA